MPNFEHKKDFVEYYRVHAKKGDKLLWNDGRGYTYVDIINDVIKFGIEVKGSDLHRMIHWNDVLEIYKPETHPEHFI
jgi:hypothetical protein